MIGQPFHLQRAQWVVSAVVSESDLRKRALLIALFIKVCVAIYLFIFETYDLSTSKYMPLAAHPYPFTGPETARKAPIYPLTGPTGRETLRNAHTYPLTGH